MLTTSTPEVVNPVSDACEAAGVPCISTVVPWEAWYFGRGAKPGDKPAFKCTYHFCFGVEEFAAGLLPRVDRRCTTNKKVGVLYPNDADGNAIRAALGPLLEKAGYTVVDPGAYNDGTNDYSVADRAVQDEELRDLQHLPDPAGLRDVLAAGRAAGLQAHDRADRQDRPVPLAGRGARRASARACRHRATGRRPSRTVVADRRPAQGRSPTATRRPGKQWNQQLGSTAGAARRRLSPRSRPRRPEGQGRRGQGDRQLQVDTPLGHLDWTRAGRRTSSPRRSSAASGSRATKYRSTSSLCENAADPNVPIAAKLKPYNALCSIDRADPRGGGLRKRFGALVGARRRRLRRRRGRGGGHRRPERRRQDDAARRAGRRASARTPGTVRLRGEDVTAARRRPPAAGAASAARTRSRGRSAA